MLKNSAQTVLYTNVTALRFITLLSGCSDKLGYDGCHTINGFQVWEKRSVYRCLVTILMEIRALSNLDQFIGTKPPGKGLLDLLGSKLYIVPCRHNLLIQR